MTWTVNDQEYASVMTLDPPKRYAYWIKRVADWEEVWSLASPDGWVLMGDDEGRELVPVWPHPRYASAFASGDWEGCEPKAISLDDWLGKWVPGMERDGQLVAVFPTLDGKGIRRFPAQVRDDLEEELENY